MPSLIPGFEYDVFISYRQNDNRSGWVTAFVEHLREELASTLKDPVNVFFDENPHDGLLETHHVNKSLEGRLKCLLFIPILSRTYCDTKSFAWNNEFLAFRNLARNDQVGLYVKVRNGNVAGRILPVLIHDLDRNDLDLFEKESDGVLRAVDFTFRSPGVNRPLLPEDPRNENLTRAVYRDQVNKVANATAEVIQAIVDHESGLVVPRIARTGKPEKVKEKRDLRWFISELLRRNVIRAGIAYAATSWVLSEVLAPLILRNEASIQMLTAFLVGGFPLAIILAWLYERSPSGVIRTNSEESATNPYVPSQKKPFTSIWIIIILLGLLVIQQYGPQLLSNEKSIAVLPFENRSTDKEDEYFADGLTDDIINNLSIISKLRVISRGSIQEYKGKGLDYKKIAEELGVESLVIGSVQRTGDVVKITARLINGSTQDFLWGETFQRELKDFLAVQADISRRIADRLKIRLSELEDKKLGSLPTENFTAYDYYIKGRGFYYKYNSDANDEAIIWFKKAIAIDQNYSLAWAGLGDAYSQMSNRFGRGQQWLDSSIFVGTKAIQLDSNSSDALKALANAYNYKRNFDRGFDLLKKAVKLNPNNAPAVANLGTTFFNRGNLPEALRWLKKSASISPRSFATHQVVGWTYRLLGDYDNAALWLEKSMKLNNQIYDTYEQLGYTYASKGRQKEALLLVHSAVKINEDDPKSLEVAGLISHFAGDARNAKKYFQLSIDKNPQYQNDPNTISALGLGQILMEEGKIVEAEIYLSHVLDVYLNQIEKGSQSFNPPYYVSGVYAVRGNKEESLKWLQKAIDMGWTDQVQITMGPWFAKVRMDSAFQSLVGTLRKKTEGMRQLAEKE